MFPVEIWGTVGEWAASLLTGTSLLLAYRILRIDRNDKRRAQAGLVTFVCEPTYDLVSGAEHGTSGQIHNYSDAPIMYVSVCVMFNPRHVLVTKPWQDIANIRRDQPLIAYNITEQGANSTPALLPGTTTDFAFNYPMPVDDGVTLFELRFDDANGRTWRRDVYGRLRLVKGMGWLTIIKWLAQILKDRRRFQKNAQRK